MDTLRGAFDSDIPADDSQDWGSDYSAPEEDNVREMPPEAIGQDERRMQVRAYNHWASLLGDATFPSIEELEPDNLHDFGPNSVLLDFSAGIDDPTVVYLGKRLGAECGTDGVIERLSDVPPRSLLSRITDHYMQILANQAPIGFEAEFYNQRGSAILYRGILLPFSSDDETIDFIYGVINWKEMADAATADELLLEIDQAIDGATAAADEDSDAADDEVQAHKHHADALTEWADSPASEELDGDGSDEGFGGELAGNRTEFGDTVTSVSELFPGDSAEDMDEETGDSGAADNIASLNGFAGLNDASDDLPMPDFGQFNFDEELHEQFGDEDEEEDEDGGNYSFASLSDYLETPVKKAIDLDAEHFDPEDYRVEETAPARGVAEAGITQFEDHAQEVDGHESDLPQEETGEDESDEDVSPEDHLGEDDAFDLGGLEMEESVFTAPEPAGPTGEDTVDDAAESAGENTGENTGEYTGENTGGSAGESVGEPAASEPTDALGPQAGLHDCLASARALAQSASISEDRSRQALYAAVGRAYDVSLAAEEEPDAYNDLIAECGLTVQERAPMTPVVKLVFGQDYDKTRLTEYAAVLSHAHRIGIERGSLAGYLTNAEGGLKGVVNAERRLRREEAGKEVEEEGEVRAQLAQKLRELDEILLEALDGGGPEFSLVMVRRDETGTASLIGEVSDDVALIERVGKRLVG